VVEVEGVEVIIEEFAGESVVEFPLRVVALLEEAGHGNANLARIGAGAGAGIRSEGGEAACRSEESNTGCESKEQVAGVLHWTKVFHSDRNGGEIKCGVGGRRMREGQGKGPKGLKGPKKGPKRLRGFAVNGLPI